MLIHGKEASKDVQYWKEVTGQVSNVKRGNRYHKFAYKKGLNGELEAMNIIQYLAIEGYEKNQPFT